jgi:transposase
MSKTAIEVITSVERRRRWSAAEKERLVAASLEPGASGSIARDAKVHRASFMGGGVTACAGVNSAPVRIASGPGLVELAVGGAMRSILQWRADADLGAVDAATVTAAVAG